MTSLSEIAEYWKTLPLLSGELYIAFRNYISMLVNDKAAPDDIEKIFMSDMYEVLHRVDAKVLIPYIYSIFTTMGFEFERVDTDGNGMGEVRSVIKRPLTLVTPMKQARLVDSILDDLERRDALKAERKIAEASDGNDDDDHDHDLDHGHVKPLLPIPTVTPSELTELRNDVETLSGRITDLSRQMEVITDRIGEITSYVARGTMGNDGFSSSATDDKEEQKKLLDEIEEWRKKYDDLDREYRRDLEDLRRKLADAVKDEADAEERAEILEEKLAAVDNQNGTNEETNHKEEEFVPGETVPMPEDRDTETLKNLDVDGDGVVERNELMAADGILDDHPDGVITDEEARKLAEVVKEAHEAGDTADETLKKLDIDNDGMIEPGELQIMDVDGDGIPSAEEVKKLEKAADLDGDGEVSSSEIAAIQEPGGTEDISPRELADALEDRMSNPIPASARFIRVKLSNGSSGYVPLRHRGHIVEAATVGAFVFTGDRLKLIPVGLFKDLRRGFKRRMKEIKRNRQLAKQRKLKQRQAALQQRQAALQRRQMQLQQQTGTKLDPARVGFIKRFARYMERRDERERRRNAEYWRNRRSPITSDYAKFVRGLFVHDVSLVGAQRATRAGCRWCGAKATLACGGCMLEHYCSEECQAADWNAYHKHVCGKFAGIREAVGRIAKFEDASH